MAHYQEWLSLFVIVSAVQVLGESNSLLCGRARAIELNNQGVGSAVALTLVRPRSLVGVAAPCKLRLAAPKATAFSVRIIDVEGNNQAPASSNSSNNEVFHQIAARLTAVDPQLARDLGGIYLFYVMKNQDVKAWTMDLNAVRVYEGEPPEEEEPDATFTLSEETMVALAYGKVAARHVIAAGKCSVTGDVMRAMKLEPYIKL